MPIERLLHDAALHAFAAPVNQTDLAKTRGVRRGDVLVDDRWDVTREERVEVDRGLDGDLVRHVRGLSIAPRRWP
jgi:hypothetical protein